MTGQKDRINFKPLEIPPQDQRKLHAEVNQLINQSFVLTTTTITVFGLFSSWLFIEEISAKECEVSICFTRYMYSIALVIVLYLLLFWSIYLEKTWITNSRYLIVRGISQWESDAHSYYVDTKKARPAVFDVQDVVFCAMDILSLFLPGLSFFARAELNTVLSWVS